MFDVRSRAAVLEFHLVLNFQLALARQSGRPSMQDRRPMQAGSRQSQKYITRRGHQQPAAAPTGAAFEATSREMGVNIAREKQGRPMAAAANCCSDYGRGGNGTHEHRATPPRLI